MRRRLSPPIVVGFLLLVIILGFLTYQTVTALTNDPETRKYDLAPPAGIELPADPNIIDADKLQEPFLSDDEYLALADQTRLDVALLAPLSPTSAQLSRRVSQPELVPKLQSELNAIAASIGGESQASVGATRILNFDATGARVAVDITYQRTDQSQVSVPVTLSLTYDRKGDSGFLLAGLDVAGAAGGTGSE